MSKIHRKLIAVAAGLALSSVSALASHLPTINFGAQNFIVNPSAIGENFSTFTAGAINFAYNSEVDQFGGSGTSANFNQTGVARFGPFLTNVGGDPIGASETGLNLSTTTTAGYGLYALFDGAGTITTTNQGPNTAGGTYTTFNVSLFADPSNNTMFGALPDSPGEGFIRTRIVPTSFSEDVLVLTGILSVGGFHITTGVQQGQGDFDVLFNITGFGPTSFFSTNTSGQRLSRGDFNGVISTLGPNVVLPPGGFIDGEIRGSGNVSVAAVPEPGTLALMGLALAGLGFARRKTAAAQQAV